jgi:hypothetical protein
MALYKKENLINLRNEIAKKYYDAYIIPHSDQHDVFIFQLT